VYACCIVHLRQMRHLEAPPGWHAARLFCLIRHERAQPQTTPTRPSRTPMRQSAPQQPHTRAAALLLAYRAGGIQKLGSKYRRPEHENAVRALVARPASRAPRAPATNQHLFYIATCPSRTVRLPGRTRSQDCASAASVAQLFSASNVQRGDVAAAARYAWC